MALRRSSQKYCNWFSNLFFVHSGSVLFVLGSFYLEDYQISKQNWKFTNGMWSRSIFQQQQLGQIRGLLNKIVPDFQISFFFVRSGSVIFVLGSFYFEDYTTV